MNNQTAPDMEALREDMKSWDLSGEAPKEVKDLGEGSPDDQKGKAAHKFAEQSKNLKTAKEVIEGFDEREKAWEKEKKALENRAPVAAPDANAQALAYESNLQVRAMQNLGVTDPTNPILEREKTRLYNEDMVDLKRRQDAPQEIETVQTQVFAKHKQLDEGDKKAITESLTSLDALQQASSEVVEDAVLRYKGSHLDKFAKVSNGQSDKTRRGVSPGQAASTPLRTQGNTGVAPGDNAGGDDEGNVKPATPEELKKMRGAGIPIDRVDLYRAAESKKEKY